jgi:tellurite resistance protein
MNASKMKKARPTLVRIQASLFGIPLGLMGLSGAWGRLGFANWEVSAPIADGLFFVALALLALLLCLWLAKWALYPQAVQQEWSHPVQGALMALIPVSLMLALTLMNMRWPSLSGWLFPMAISVLCLKAVMAWHVVADISMGKTLTEFITPALYLPIVPGGFVGAIALESFGLHGWAALLFGMGVGAWALLEIRILHRLFSGPLPLALRPTLGLEMAPAAVGALSAVTLWPHLPPDAMMVILGVASGPVLAVMTRWRYWTETPFSAGFWSFSFPIAALAGAVVHSVHTGGWPLEVALVAVGISTAVTLFLTLRTARLLFTGRLLGP